MEQTTITKRILIAGTCVLLSACGEGTLSERIGLERKPPDEFRVLSRPPLTVPPEFRLRPPAELGESGGVIQPTSRQAETLVFGEDGTTTSLRPGSADTAVTPVTIEEPATDADAKFLSNIGADDIDPNIRNTLRKENKDYVEEDDKSFIEKLREPTNNEPTVDAKKEAERIEKNKTEGKPIDEGETPTKTKPDRGIIDKIL